jgi:membrane protein involved in colicin uptake
VFVADLYSDIPQYEIPAPESARSRAHRLALAFIKRRQALPTRHIFAGVAAVALSVVVHAILLGSFVWGWAAVNSRRPDARGVGAGLADSSQGDVMTMIFISEPQAAAKPSEANDMPSRDLTARDLGPDSSLTVDLAQVADAATVQIAEATDSADRATLFDRYRGQITAQIERSWVRPRISIGNTLFQCQVAITQDQRGNVLEVRLQDCNGGGRWQQSLVNAIQSASPLPAPPEAAVFSSTLTLRIESMEYPTSPQL